MTRRCSVYTDSWRCRSHDSSPFNSPSELWQRGTISLQPYLPPLSSPASLFHSFIHLFIYLFIYLLPTSTDALCFCIIVTIVIISVFSRCCFGLWLEFALGFVCAWRVLQLLCRRFVKMSFLIFIFFWLFIVCFSTSCTASTLLWLGYYSIFSLPPSV